MGHTLANKTVVVVGRGSGIARAVALRARSEGAQVVVAGRNKDKLAAQYADPGIGADVVDITDDESIGALAERLGRVDHVGPPRLPALAVSSVTWSGSICD